MGGTKLHLSTHTHTHPQRDTEFFGNLANVLAAGGDNLLPEQSGTLISVRATLRKKLPPLLPSAQVGAGDLRAIFLHHLAGVLLQLAPDANFEC